MPQQATAVFPVRSSVVPSFEGSWLGVELQSGGWKGRQVDSLLTATSDTLAGLIDAAQTAMDDYVALFPEHFFSEVGSA